MRFDLKTLLLLDLLASVELVPLFALAGWMLRGRLGLRFWVGGMSSAAAGRLIMTLASESIPGASLLGILLLGLSPALLWVGIREHCKRSRPLLPVASSLLVVGVLWRWGGEAQYAALLASACWSAAIAWTLLRHETALRPAGTHLVYTIFIVHGACQLGCLIFSLAVEADPILAPSDVPRIAMALESIFFSVAFSFVAMGLTSQRFLGKMREAARIDGLTGMLNRRALLSDGERTLEFCRRRERPCAVVMADIDHFKRLNDSMGHAAGDEALRLFAAEAGSAAGQWAVLGRYGGEEFCAVLPGAGEEKARRWAEDLRSRIASSGKITVSFGVAVGSGPGMDLTKLIGQADQALYRAKEQGRDRVCA